MTASSGLQKELNRTDKWCDDNNGGLHPDKASGLQCSFNNRVISDQMPYVKIAGKVIKRDDNLRYLGEDFQNRPVKAGEK